MLTPGSERDSPGKQRLDDGARRFITGIAENRPENSFQDIGQQALLFPAAAVLFPFAQQQAVAKLQLPGKSGQPLFTHHLGPNAGQLPLGNAWEIPKHSLAHDQIDNGIAQEFKALIVGSTGLFVAVGLMAQGLPEQRGISKRVTQPSLERLLVTQRRLLMQK